MLSRAKGNNALKQFEPLYFGFYCPYRGSECRSLALRARGLKQPVAGLSERPTLIAGKATEEVTQRA